MSGSVTPERDQQLLDIGKQCSESSCLVVDFLPFKCQHCTHAFCGDHFLPTAHHCDKYDAAKLDRVAPSCPLCNTPVAIPPGQDPNIRMEQHINTQCSVMTGKPIKAKSTPICARPKCKKALFAPIQCASCKQQYCPQHRFPQDHACAHVQSLAKSSASSSPWANVANQTGAASAAAKAAVKRATASAANASSLASRAQTQNRPPAHAAANPPAASSRSNPFSATERVTILLTTPSTAVPPAHDSLDDPNNDSPQRCTPKPTAPSMLPAAPSPLSGTA